MDQQKQRRFIFTLDGLRYSFSMAALAWKRLEATLDALAHTYSVTNGADEELSVSALLDTWTIIDMCHRVRELLQQLPMLSQNTPDIQIFLRATEGCEHLRHHVQHFRTGIKDVPSLCDPLWGSLSWSPTHDPKVCYLLFPGNLQDGISATTCSYDRVAGEFSGPELASSETRIPIRDVATRLATLDGFVVKWLDQLSLVKRASGKPLVLKMSVREVKGAPTVA